MEKLLIKEDKCPLANPNGLMNYRLYGKGDIKIVFQMGLNTTGEFYEFIVKSFFDKKSINDYQICLFDSRGVYKSSGIFIPGYSTSKMADDMASLMDYLNYGKCHIIGISQGGMVMQEFCSKYPNRVLSVCFLSTYSGQMPHSMTLIRGTYHLIALNHKVSDEVAQDRINLAMKNEFKLIKLLPHSLGCLFHYKSKYDLERLKQYPFPKVVVVGSDDTLINPINSHMISEQIGIPIKVLEGQGHGLETSAPNELADILIEQIEISKSVDYTKYTSIPPQDKIKEFYQTQTFYRFFILGYLLCYISCIFGGAKCPKFGGLIGGIIFGVIKYLNKHPYIIDLSNYNRDKKKD